MRNSTRPAALLGIVFLGGAMCLAPGCWRGGGTDGDAADFVGTYTYVGTNPDGSTYQGEWVAEIRKTGDTYHVTWTKAGEPPEQGIGILDGDRLCVAYDSGGAPGVMVFKPGSGGKLDVLWTFVGQERIGTETFTPKQ
jgi:hypothetical protein